MLIVETEKDTYPDGVLPNLDTDDEAFKDCYGRFHQYLEQQTAMEVVGTLLIWSSHGFKHQFATWAEAVKAAGSKNDVKPKTGNVFGRSEDLSNQEVNNLKKGLASVDDTDDPQIVNRERSKKLANCGRAAFQILEQIRTANGKLARQSATRFAGTEAGKELDALLVTLPPEQGQVILLDCQFPDAHNFLIEVYPDGRRYLAQGYQGAYYATWWMGDDDEQWYPGDRDVATIGMRALYGRGLPIADNYYRLLVDRLVATIGTKSWQEAGAIWPGMPFYPSTSETESVSRRAGSPELGVEVYLLANPQEVATRLRIDNQQHSLSELAVHRISYH